MTEHPTGGRLAQVIATRGGLAPPEAPFVIEHREALYYMLCEAAELEHGIMCQYLYAAFSLKQTEAEGLSPEQAQAVQRWRQRISHVATQEMLHLSLVQNMLTAIGGAPHLTRPNFPHPATHYPAGVHLALLPFGEAALQHFMFLERPEGMDLNDAEGLAAYGRAAPAMTAGEIVPRGQDFKTVGHLYRSIEAGFAHLAGQLGEQRLFIGPPRAQATQQYFRWPELVAVTDLASAQRAIDEILEQGEGPRGHWRDAHFGQFVAIMDEYTQLREADPAFEPVRPVVTVNVRPSERDTEVPLVTDPIARQVMDLFNVCYEALLTMLQRFFAHTEETDAQLTALADATVAVMSSALKPLGDLVTTLPAGPDYPGRTAGPSFELFYETDTILPHREAAWIMMTERLRQAAAFCSPGAPCAPSVADALAAVEARLTAVAESLEAHLPGSPPPPAPPTDPPDTLLARAEELSRPARNFAAPAAAAALTASDADLPASLAALIRSAHAAAQAAPGHPRTLARLVNSVLRPRAETLPTPAPTPAPPAPSPQAPPDPAPTLWDLAQFATQLHVLFIQFARSAPPGLLEASAALQDLAVADAPPGDRPQRIAALSAPLRALPPAIVTAHNGPYLATNIPAVRTPLGAKLPLPPQLALCRCGASARKPFCDGSHATSGFTDGKDPKRVPDQRDTYPGEQVTIFDNRGICQHSGLCTDRLATAFRTSQEPFVAPSGARMDELIRAVRDCPSGALGLALDGVEARDLADWHGTREPAIEITQDGPYRVTGGIPLSSAAETGAPGAAAAEADVPRAAGASREHYALCRCGHSQNKPFCSGMHWYVGFRDPVRPGEPTLFEWAGGLPALTRMTRLLYDKHVPADDLLAPLFAGMPPAQPQLEAAQLAQAFGAPAPQNRAPEPPLRPAFTEPQRARWVALALRAADEAVLPADPGFRGALASYLEWASRTAGAPSADGRSLPSWDWGPAGPPAPEPAAAPDGVADVPVPVPGPGEPVSFGTHIKPLFRPLDRQSMTFAFDLWSYDDVRANAASILDRLVNGSMPCDGAWPPDRTGIFRRWTETGLRP
jgi:CDGSH-type Zn-finger protein